MCSTALPPPPPTPMTLICVPWLNSSISIISMLIFILLFFRSCQFLKIVVCLMSTRERRIGAPPSPISRGTGTCARQPEFGRMHVLEIPDDKVLEAPEGRLHGTVF